ncbi:MAG: DUF4169 family protein [Pseudomonadota bacterium]
MNEPVNLNKHRKQKMRAQKKARADENAARFGRTKAAKKAAAAELLRAQQKLYGHKCDQ